MLVKKHFNVLAALLLFLFSFSLYAYKLKSSHIYHTDIARDADEMIQLSQGHFTLIGPKLNFGGLYAGPYYYYLFAPILFLSNYNLNSVLIFNALLFSIALIYFFKKISKKYSTFWATISTIEIALLPLYHLMSKNPGNAYSYMPLLLFFLTYLYFNSIQSVTAFVGLGVFAGIIINFHPLIFIVFIPIAFLLAILAKKKVNLLFFLIGIIITYMPLLIFELRHDFVVLKKTIYDYNNSLLTSVNSPDNVWGDNFISRYLSSDNVVGDLVLFNPVIYLFIFLSPFIRWLKIKHLNLLRYDIFSDKIRFVKSLKNEYPLKLRLFIFSSLVSFSLYVLVARGDICLHYVFPFAFFMFFALVIFILNSNLKFLAIIIIILEVMKFNTNLYKNSIRPKEKFEKAVNYIIDNNLVNKNDAFNVIQTIDKVPAGHEYRFFFRVKGYSPKTINEYNISDKLFIFSENKDYKIESMRNWETGQFGQEYLKNYKTFQAGDIIVYLVDKNF